MVDEIISDASQAGATVDSLSANEFEVELEGQKVTGIFRISGLIPFKLDIKPSLTRIVRDPFKIAKMVQRDPANVFNMWIRDTVKAKEDIVRPTRTLAILAVDDGVETRRWTIKGAYISEISYSDFNTASSELVEEVLTIHYDGVEESWNSTP